MNSNKSSKKNQNDVKRKSKKSKQKNYIIKPIITIALIIIIILILIFGSIVITKRSTKLYANHLRTHLATISYNAPELKHRNFNGHYNMIFYMHNCPHCQQVIPKAYINNKLHLRKIQYHDVVPDSKDKNNLKLIDKMHINKVPMEVKVIAHHGKITSYHKLARIN